MANEKNNRQLVVFGAPNGGGGGNATWGSITGVIDNQTDLMTELGKKADTSALATVATSGNYSDLTGTPTLATVATSGSYSDLTGTPTIPTVNDATITIQQNGTTVGTFTTNGATDTTINLAGGGDDDEDQVLLPLYFENKSDASKDVYLKLEYNTYASAHPSISLKKSSNNTDWESISIPQTNNGTTTITIPAKSRVYIKGVNSKFCQRVGTSSYYYNHYYFTTDSANTEDIWVGGNLMSLIRGDDFLTITSRTLEQYAFCKLFVDGLNIVNGDGYIMHFEKMVVGLPNNGTLTPNTGSFSKIIVSTVYSPLNLSHKSISFFNSGTDCCENVQDILLNNYFSSDVNCLTSNTHGQQRLHLGFCNGMTGVSSYAQLSNKPTIPTVNDATITLQDGGGTTIDSFTLNQSSDKTITIPSGANQWFGTQSQFDALGTYDDNTDYYISDKLDYNTDLKNKPNLSSYATKSEVAVKNAEQDTEIAGKLGGHFMTQQEFDALGNNVPEGENYFIEGSTVEMVVTFTDQSTATYNVVVD